MPVSLSVTHLLRPHDATTLALVTNETVATIENKERKREREKEGTRKNILIGASMQDDNKLKTATKGEHSDDTRQTRLCMNRSKKHWRQIGSSLILDMLILIALTRPIVAWIVDFNNPIVHTQYGSIRGKIDERKTKFNRRPICTFLSIPYARPPVGSNRFLVSNVPPPPPPTRLHMPHYSLLRQLLSPCID